MVANAARFEPDHPEMLAIEIAKTQNNQPDNPETNQNHNNNPNATNTQSVEQQPIPAIKVEQQPLEAKPDMLSEKALQSEKLILELVEQKWHFRLKAIKGKIYLCARKDQKERYLGPYSKEIREIMEKNSIAINDYTNSKISNKETP